MVTFSIRALQGDSLCESDPSTLGQTNQCDGGCGVSSDHIVTSNT